MRRVDKRGQELTLGTVILIILGIVVLVFLIFGFSTGWGNLWDRMSNIAGGKSNLDSIRSGCEVACLSNNVEDFCRFQRTVRYDGTESAWNGKDMGNVTSSPGTCYDISQNTTRYPRVNVATCPSINCASV
jgi:hypothetical protein